MKRRFDGLLARLSRVLALMRLEALHLMADRSSLSLILLVPATQLVLFGYAVNLTPTNIAVAVAPRCHERMDKILQAVSEVGSFHLIDVKSPHDDAARYVSSSSALIAIDCPKPETVELIADGTNPLQARAAIGALRASLLTVALSTVLEEPVAIPPVRWLYNPDSRTVWFLAPGLIGVIVMISTLMLGALTLVRERERGSFDGLLSSPLTALDVLLGKLSPYVLIAILQALVVMGLAHWLFQLPLRGDVASLVVAGSVFAVAHLTLGLTLSALAQSQTQAVQAAVFFYLPSILLSGFMFPFESMPHWARLLGNTLPLTHFVRAARGVLLKGYDAREIVMEMWPVAVFAASGALMAVAVLRRQLR